MKNIMDRDNGGIDYTDNEKLEYGANYPDADRTTEIIFSPDKGVITVSSDDESGEESLSAAQAEARAGGFKDKVDDRR